MGKTLTRFVLGGTVLFAALGFLFDLPAVFAAEEEPEPVVLEADSVVYDQQAGTAWATGNAHVSFGLLRLNADSIVLDEEMTRVKATSSEDRGVRLRYGERTLEGNDLEYRFDEQVGMMHKTKGEANAIRFEGDAVEFATLIAAKEKGWLKARESGKAASDDLVIRGSNMSFTTCTEEMPAYRLRTKRLLIFPGHRIVAVKPQIYLEEHLLATYPADYTINLEKGTASGVLLPSFFYDDTRGAGLVLKYGFQAGDRLEGDLDLRFSEKQDLEGTVGAAFLLFENVEAFVDTSYLYNEDEDEKRWRPSWGLRSVESEGNSVTWAVLWSERESVDIRQGTGATYKGVLWRDPEVTITSPWWGGDPSGKKGYRLLGTWGRYEEEGQPFERKGLGFEFKGESGSRETLQPFWWGRASRFDYDTGEDRTVLEGSLGLRWERWGWGFESRFEKRWVDGSTPMSWDDLEEIEEAYQTVEWPISERWRFAVRAGYDLLRENFHEMAYRLAYDRECYRFEVFYVNDRSGDDDLAGIRLQVKAFPESTLSFLDPGTGGFGENRHEEAFR